MILDPNGIAASAGDLDDDRAEASDAKSATKPRKSGTDEPVAMLVFRAGGDEPKAVPLSLIARLEEIDARTIEQSDGCCVLQYRGQLMPLVSFRGGNPPRTEGRQPILVFAERERRMGLLVDEIVDIVDQQFKVQLGGEAQGTLGSAVIAGKATDVIDAGYYLRQAHANWFAAPPQSEKSGEAGGSCWSTIRRSSVTS